MNTFRKNIILCTSMRPRFRFIFCFLPHDRRFSYIHIRIFKLHFNINLGVKSFEELLRIWELKRLIVKVDITPNIIWRINTIDRFHYLAGYYKGKKIAFQSTFERPGAIVLMGKYQSEYTIEYDRYDDFRILK